MPEMTPDDLSPTLVGGPVEWKFEERRQATTFRMPAEVERTRKMIDALRASVAASQQRLDEVIRVSDEDYARLREHGDYLWPRNPLRP